MLDTDTLKIYILFYWFLFIYLFIFGQLWVVKIIMFPLYDVIIE